MQRNLLILLLLNRLVLTDDALYLNHLTLHIDEQLLDSRSNLLQIRLLSIHIASLDHILYDHAEVCQLLLQLAELSHLVINIFHLHLYLLELVLLEIVGPLEVLAQQLIDFGAPVEEGCKFHQLDGVLLLTWPCLIRLVFDRNYLGISHYFDLRQ